MSTRANIRVDGIGDKGSLVAEADFHVNSDGGNEQGIRECFEAAISDWRGNVKSSHLSRAVINQLGAIATSGYGYLLPGLIEDGSFVDYNWRVEVGSRGRVVIEQTA